MRILVVDDDEISRIKLTTLFAAYGQVDSAPDGESACAMFESAHKDLSPYGLVTMDVEMPGMNGPEAVKRMREVEEALGLFSAKGAKILMVTVKKEMKTVSNSYHEGCDGYLTKPTTPEDVVRALAELGLRN